MYWLLVISIHSLVDNNVVYLGKRDVIKTEEFKKVVKALNQVQDFDNFMNSSNVISELTSLNGNAIDKDGNETIYKEDNITHKSKTEVLFDSYLTWLVSSHLRLYGWLFTLFLSILSIILYSQSSIEPL